LETCGLFFVHMINAAQQRLWITSPYFVPDPQVICALQLASLRGVDVRIMLPQRPDHLLVYLSSFSYLEEAEQADVKIYRYQPGFMHHKVILVDDHLAAVGTANLDNRSFRLNFEIIVLVEDRTFAAQVEDMLRRDFEASAHTPRLTMRWDREPRAEGRHFGLLAAPDAALVASDRVHAALVAVGDDLGQILLKVCCLESGLEAAERALGWPKRSGKLVLKIALGRLAAHYGMGGR